MYDIIFTFHQTYTNKKGGILTDIFFLLWSPRSSLEKSTKNDEKAQQIINT